MVTIIPPADQENILVTTTQPRKTDAPTGRTIQNITRIETIELQPSHAPNTLGETLNVLNKDFTQQIEKLNADKKVFIIERAGKYMKRINTYENETARRVTVMKDLDINIAQRKSVMEKLEIQLRNYDELLTSVEDFTSQECKDANIDIDDIRIRGEKDAIKYKSITTENIADQSKLLRYGDDLLRFEEAIDRNQSQIDKITKDADDIYTSIIEYFTDFQQRLKKAAEEESLL